ncbi:MAG: RNA polymerase sigma factor [Candidatus Gastranaerophilales bacterium]|nr:RNA polymerase sigma factor [Candidatus Gastranaerophilales bacterium]
MKTQKITSDEEAFLSGIFHKYYTDLYLYVSTHIHNPSAVDDIVADTFALACEKIEDLKVHPNQKGWLIRTAHNKTREMYRQMKNSGLSYDETEVENHPADSPYEMKELELTIESALTPVEHRRFLRYFIWGCSVKELAALEDTSENNTSVRLTRIRQKIAEKLGKGYLVR